MCLTRALAAYAASAPVGSQRHSAYHWSLAHCTGGALSYYDGGGALPLAQTCAALQLHTCYRYHLPLWQNDGGDGIKRAIGHAAAPVALINVARAAARGYIWWQNAAGLSAAAGGR